MPPVRQRGGSGDRLAESLHSVRNCALPRREPKFKRVGHFSLNDLLSLVSLPSFGCVTFQTNGCSTHPANLWVLTTDRPGRMLWSSNDNRSDGNPSLRNADSSLPLGSV